MLQIIIFCLFLGVALLALGDRAAGIVRLIGEGNDVMLKITEYVIAFSPIGILSLMASMVSTISSTMMKEVLAFIATIDVTIIIFMLVFYPLVLALVAKLNIVSFFKRASSSMLVAFTTTTSSAATLPVSIDVAESKLAPPAPSGTQRGLTDAQQARKLKKASNTSSYGRNFPTRRCGEPSGTGRGCDVQHSGHHTDWW